jgi:cysteine sulfinate desulfinase/cysteine desulfurase-like protein
MRAAAIWSAETPERMLAPSVLGAREEGGHRAGVVAAAVAVGAGLVGREAGENGEVAADVIERREDRW